MMSTLIFIKSEIEKPVCVQGLSVLLRMNNFHDLRSRIGASPRLHCPAS